jgi:tetratricopeptide (TPR) repeat protein
MKPMLATAAYLLALAVSALAQQPAPGDAALRHDALGVAAGDAGRIAIALQEFDTAIELDPTLAPAHFHRALALERTGRTREALAGYQRALVLNPDLWEARYGLSSVCATLGDLDGAIALLEQIVTVLPDLGEAHYNLGVNIWNRYKRSTALRKPEDLDRALSELRTATRLWPTAANFHAALGQLLVDMQQLQPAIESLRKALELANDPLYAYDLGLALRLAGDLDGAEAQFRAALAKIPAHGFAHRALGLVLRQKGDLEGAAVELKSATALLPVDAQSYQLLGSVLIKLSRDGGIEALTHAVELDPDSTEARATLAQALVRAGRRDEAEHQQYEIESINAVNASLSRAMIALESGMRAIDKGDRTAGLEQLSKATVEDPSFAEARYRLGAALMAGAGTDLKASEQHLTRAVELDPRYAPALYQLGVLKARRGDAAGALASLRRATELAPGFLDAHRELAAQAWQEKDWPTVLGSLRSIVAWQPGDAKAHFALARALAEQGDRDGAARELAIAQRLDPSIRNPP